MSKTLKYNSAAEYVNGSPQAKYLDDAVKEQLVKLTVKRKGVYSLRKTAPKKDKPSQLAVFLAFKTARHLASWGDLNSWNEGQTYALMLMSPADRALFEAALDNFNDAFKASMGARYARAYGAY